MKTSLIDIANLSTYTLWIFCLFVYNKSMRHNVMPNYAFNTASMKSKKDCIECNKEFMSAGTKRCTSCRIARRKATRDAANQRVKERRAVDKKLQRVPNFMIR